MTQKKTQSPPPKAGVYAGSFDPITRGHTDIILQAARLLPKLHVVVGVNPLKSGGLFTPDERVDMIRHEIETAVKPQLEKEGIACDIKVAKHSGLTVAFMEAQNAPFLIRGLRLGTEFDAEYPTLVANHKEYNKFTPVFLCTTDPHLQIISSTLARELERFSGKSVKEYVSPHVAKKLKKRIDEKGLRF
ncbi:MAG: pantetheine-phosphate adenylyltransferase [Alphaproteobacteria bacterium]|nr:pantetheine-phosphate adenylyltransferase [Alphaproteobacteria bacterium]